MRLWQETSPKDQNVPLSILGQKDKRSDLDTSLHLRLVLEK